MSCPPLCVKIENTMESMVKKLFYKLGFLIASYPVIILSISIAIFVIFSTGFMKMNETNNIRQDYTPLDSPSIYEYDVVKEFYEEKGQPFFLHMAIQDKNGGNLLSSGFINNILEVEQYLQTEMAILFDGRNVTFDQLCGAHCDTNTPLRVFLVAWRREKRSRQFKLNYPTAQILGERIYLGNHVYLVEKNGTNIESIQMVVLHFQASYSNSSSEKMLKLWEEKVFDEFYVQKIEPSLDISMISEGLTTREVLKATNVILPYFNLAFVVILVFTIVTSLRLNCVLSKPWEAFAGVLCPLMALGTAYGFLMWIEVPYHSICNVSPFLVLAVGVDDAFLTIHAWHRTNRKMKVAERMATALSNAGPSITITSLTNCMAFGIGISSTVPAIRHFCIYTSVAIIVEYLFQIFYFSSVMAIGGRREAESQNACCPLCCKRNQEESEEKCKKFKQKFHSLAAKLLRKWSALATSWPSRIVLLVLLLIYWGVAIYGIIQMKAGMSDDKLLLDDSPLKKWTNLMDQVFYKNGNVLYVFVNNPGNLSDANRLAELMQLPRDFENLPDSVGAESTAFWLRDFKRFRSFMTSSSNYFKYAPILDFLDSNNYWHWANYMTLNETLCYLEDPDCLEVFYFTTGFGMEAVGSDDWNYRVKLLETYRAIALQYSQFNVTVFEEFAMYSDQISSNIKTTKINLAVAICCMLVICSIFIPSFACIICAGLSVLSINVGVFGYLMLWNVDLDPASMASILMSIGFSVDFTAHISYHYFRETNENLRLRLEHALSSVGWPTTQAGLSTLLAMAVLALVDNYTAGVFVKTVVLVVSLGWAHALIILPAFLTALPWQNNNKVADVQMENTRNEEIAL